MAAEKVLTLGKYITPWSHDDHHGKEEEEDGFEKVNHKKKKVKKQEVKIEGGIRVFYAEWHWDKLVEKPYRVDTVKVLKGLKFMRWYHGYSEKENKIWNCCDGKWSEIVPDQKYKDKVTKK